VARLLDGRHHLERFAMEQAGEVDYLITWRDESVGRQLQCVSPSGLDSWVNRTISSIFPAGICGLHQYVRTITH
jgi:hypothetical protein